MGAIRALVKFCSQYKPQYYWIDPGLPRYGRPDTIVQRVEAQYWDEFPEDVKKELKYLDLARNFQLPPTMCFLSFLPILGNVPLDLATWTQVGAAWGITHRALNHKVMTDRQDRCASTGKQRDKRIKRLRRKRTWLLTRAVLSCLLVMLINVLPGASWWARRLMPRNYIYKSVTRWLEKAYDPSGRILLQRDFKDVHNKRHHAIQLPHKLSHSDFYEAESLRLGVPKRRLCFSHYVQEVKPSDIFKGNEPMILKCNAFKADVKSQREKREEEQKGHKKVQTSQSGSGGSSF